jgi:primosomal protein N'
MLGLGTQRLEDELKFKIPSAKVIRVDSDSMQKDNYYHLPSISMRAKSIYSQARRF